MSYVGVFARWITENGTIRFLNELGVLLLVSKLEHFRGRVD
jgi:hypothetical protein